MIFRKVGLFILLVGVVSVNTAQTGKIRFEEQVHKFGTINEENGPIVHEFRFTNTGNQPLTINSVKASCGCTTPNWTKTQVNPGEMGFIAAKFNPNNRPGPFKKSLTVKTTVGNNMLYIEGYVKPKPKTPADDFPSLIGNLRSKSKTFNFGIVTTEKSVQRSFQLFNAGEKPISFSEQAQFPSYLGVEFKPQTLAPNETGEIIISFDPNQKNTLGYVVSNILVKTDDDLSPEKSFTVMASIREYFKPMTNAEYTNAPQITFDEMVNDLGDVKQGEVVTTSFKVGNTGKKPLKLRKISTNCSCLVTSIDRNDLAPGEMTTLKVVFNTANRGGTQHKKITVYSNDPRQSIMQLTVKSSVKVTN